jgi:starch synthase
MRIVHVAAEMAPLAKVGGLGDMVGSLTKELACKNQDVELIIPRYSFIKLKGFSIKYTNFQSYEKGVWHNNTALNTILDKVKLTLIEPHKEISYFNRPNIYGYLDDPSRFIYFSRCALDYLLKQNKPTDILHIHDWHTSLCAVLYKDLFQNIGLKIKKIVLNIHNVEYQGICNSNHLDIIGLESKKYLSSKNIMIKGVPFDNVNLLKGGITYSDAIVAVSLSYSQEILTNKYGYGLEKVFCENKHKIYGILNGIDTDVWNPHDDRHIEFQYSNRMKIETIIEKKKKNKEHLQKILGLSLSSNPIISSIGRLVPQKGPDLIEHAIYSTLKNKGQFVLLGSSLIENIQNQFSKLNKKFKLSEDISINLSYNEQLAHLIYASSDFIIIPSLFEPCGLTQLIALRYGTIPIVRKTGGLGDSVFDIDDPSFSQKSINGLSFNKFNENQLDEALCRAFGYWHNDRKKLLRLIENGMHTDYSIKKTAKEYLLLYRRLINS